MDNNPHIVDLGAIPKENVVLLNPIVAYLESIIEHVLLTISPSPLLSSLLFMFFRFVFAALLLFLKRFRIRFISCMKWDSIDESLIKSWSKSISYPSGLLKKNLKLGMKALDTSAEFKNFDLNRVIFLLFLSALLYKRDEVKIVTAYHMLSNMKDVKHDIQKINEVLRKSAKRIYKEIEEFKLEFTSLSELNTLGGPYAGMFWSNERNFIVIAFKGTTISEWLINATFRHIDARSFLFGKVHEGSSAILDRNCPAARIIETIRQKATTIRKRNNRNMENNAPINIYITGHSFVGALATLLYGYLLKFPQSLGEFCILRDGTTFASPSIVDNDFAAEFASPSIDECKTLWRIVCDNDLVPRVQYYNKYSNNLMNYGDEVRFYQDGRHPSFTSNVFGDLDENWLLVDENCSDNCYNKKSGKKSPFVHKYDERLSYPDERLVPNFIRNHWPKSYFVAIEKARGSLDFC